MKTIVAMFAILFLTSCVSLKYTTSNGTIVEYSRPIFATNDSIEAQVGDAKVKINGQKIDLSTLQAIVNMAGAVK
jgi:hypothetical protein